MKTILDLPPEVRNKIYFFVESLVVPSFKPSAPTFSVDGENVVFHERILAMYNPMDTRLDYLPIPRQPSITKVCRQIRDETIPFFYGINRFLVMDLYYHADDDLATPFPKALWDWLNHIKPHISLMRHVEIDCRKDSAQRTDQIIAALTDSEFDFKVGALRESSWDGRSK